MKTLEVTRNGTMIRVNCTDEVATILTSRGTELAVKELIINTLLRDQHPQNPQQEQKEATQEVSTDTGNTKSTGKSTAAAIATTEETSAHFSSASPCPLIHIWKENEESLLIHLRHQKSDDFQVSRNHNTLWKGISTEIKNTFNVNITPQQCLNKYNSLKKRWREIIDSPSGSEAKYFRLCEEFDQQYDTKASTRPKMILDSNMTNEDNSQDVQLTSSGVKPNSTEKKVKKDKKRKLSLMDVIESHHNQFNEQITSMHNDKMRRIDRLLDLYEESVKTTNN